MAQTTVECRGRAGAGGRHLGHSDWVEITQEQVNRFAEATGDHQWIHVDPERAKKESPFGGPIAHGYLTLSLIPSLLPQILEITGFRMGVNYGTEKVRFPRRCRWAPACAPARRWSRRRPSTAGSP